MAGMEGLPSRCLAIVLCFLALCDSVKADHTREAAYVLGAVICFMFFVFVFATAGPYCFKRFCSGKYTPTAYRPLKEKSNYVPPEAPSSHVPLPSSHHTPAHTNAHHVDIHTDPHNLHHIDHHAPSHHVPSHADSHHHMDGHHLNNNHHANSHHLNGHHMTGHHMNDHHMNDHLIGPHPVDPHYIPTHPVDPHYVPPHLHRVLPPIDIDTEKPHKTLGPKPGPPPHTIASTYSKPRPSSQKPEIDDIPPPPSSPTPQNSGTTPPGAPSHILL